MDNNFDRADRVSGKPVRPSSQLYFFSVAERPEVSEELRRLHLHTAASLHACAGNALESPDVARTEATCRRESLPVRSVARPPSREGGSLSAHGGRRPSANRAFDDVLISGMLPGQS